MSKKNRSIIPDTSLHICQREAFRESLKIREIPWTPKQKEVVDCILHKDSKIVLVEGPAGSGKSILGTYCGLKLLDIGKLKEFLFIRNVLEVSDSAAMGYIKGSCEDKFGPYKAILDEKLKELLTNSEIGKLWNDGRLVPTPTNYCRGQNWAVKYIFLEECNNFTLSEFKLLLTRYAQFSKLVAVGDFFQTDLSKSKQGGFKKVFDMFNNQTSKDKGIHCFNLTKEDIRRSTITSYIIEKFEESTKPLIEPNSEMFPLT